MVDRITAPWTAEQVTALNKFQRAGQFHPFTCANRSEAPHAAVAKQQGAADFGVLTATPDGWRCLVCGYRQNWAHGFMAEPSHG